MQSTILLNFLLIGVFVTITLAAPHPQDDGDEDVEATPGPNFGPQVAQIIKGALTGDLNSILSGSFNLVEDQEIKQELNSGLGIVLATEAPLSTPTPKTVANAATAPPSGAVAPEVPVAPVAVAATPPAPQSTKIAEATLPPAPVPTTESAVELEPETTDQPEETATEESATEESATEEFATEESVDVDVVTLPPTPNSTPFGDDDEAEAGSFVDIIAKTN